MANPVQMDSCCGCAGPGPCANCTGLVGATKVGEWAPTGAGYEENDFTSDVGRYMLGYCGGAFGYTAQLEPIPGFNAFYSVWDTLVLEYQAHQWLDPQWLPPVGVVALSYGGPATAGVANRVDANFGNAPRPLGGGPYLGVHWLADNPPLTGIQGNLPPAPSGSYVGQGAAADTTAAGQSSARLTQALPANARQCKMYGMFYCDGSAPVRTQFTAPKYSGDQWPTNPGDPAGPSFMIKVPAGGGPRFTLLKLVPMFTAKGSCGIYEAPGQYVLRLAFSNDSDFLWSGTATVSAPGLAMLDGAKAWTAQPHAQTHVDFTVSMANGKGVTATLELDDAYGRITTLSYDLTPTLLGVRAVSNGTSFVDPSRNRLTISFDNSNGLCFDDLVAGVQLTGGVTGIFDPFTGQPKGELDAGIGVQGCDVPAFDLVFDITTSTARPASVTLSVEWLDNGQPAAQPPLQAVVPLLWT